MSKFLKSIPILTVLVILIFQLSSPAFSSAVPENAVTIDANNVLVPYALPALLGGNNMSNRVWDYNFNIYKELGDTGRNLTGDFTKPWWRIHLTDIGLNQDLGMFNKDFYKRPNGLNNPMINEDDSKYNWQMQYPIYAPDVKYSLGPNGEPNQNYYEIGWFDHSPTYSNYAGIFNRHSIVYAKIPGSCDQKQRHLSREKETSELGNFDVFYRFDIKLASKLPFYVEENAFIINGSRFRVFFNPDRSLKVIAGVDFDESVLIEKTAPLDFDKWYALEIKIGKNSALWFNGKKIAEITLTNAQVANLLNGKGKSTEIQTGTIIAEGKKYAHSLASQLNDSYKFKIDELEIRTKYVGLNPKYPLDQSFKKKFIDEVIIAHSFDHSLQTLDDLGAQAEKLSLELVFGLPNPCMVIYGCEKDTLAGKFRKIHSVEGHSAMIQYMTGKADSDYQNKALELIAADFPVDDLAKYNYANLRAYRGRKNPYSLKYVEIGNEPYYAEYKNNPAGFAQFYIDQCRALKKIKPGLQCIIPGQDDYYGKILAYIAKNAPGEGLISGVGIHDYFLHLKPEGGYYLNRQDLPLRTMAGPYADNYQRYQKVKKFSEQYLPNEPNFQNFFYLSNEFSSIVRNYKEEAPDKFVDAGMNWSELAYLLENGFKGGATFVWNTASFGEGLVHGLVGDYSRAPNLTLTGAVYRNFARHFAWGGKVLKTEYDQKLTYDPLSKLNIPQLTVISGLSSDNNRLFISIFNRSNEDLDIPVNLLNFLPAAKANAFILNADNIMNSFSDIQFVKSSIPAGETFRYSAPALSISFIELDRQVQPQ